MSHAVLGVTACCSPALSAGLVLLSSVSSGAKPLCVCGVGQYINLKEKQGMGGFLEGGGEGDVN